ncbi:MULTISPECIES: multidrug transporter subunit MdtN [unclassified Duganella]|uniref:multidrug transporter subunit MdtN n=1 Tax=unclassified Duganella TaxID=2636909 RepID=UPI000E357A5B|nr:MULTISPECIES: multidrug transporter subunit MdtN [unclassified Duganella]RFP15819.1 multidrug transporter subunit MdtN [Duganella sp. BJB475]RFP33016.1 multidrug transporter subunit MdtN [Duganella sp. BJB476]
MTHQATASPAADHLRRAGWRRFALPLVALLALAALAYAVSYVDSYPRTDDAFVQADTIGVASQVAGRIVSLKARDNAVVARGDILFVIDRRPYQLDVERLRAQLATLEAQIGLTQRQVDAQRYAADAAGSNVARARQTAAQRQSSLQRLEPLLADEFVTREQVELARTARGTADAELQSALLERKRAASAVSGVDALVAQKRELAAAIAHADYLLEQTVVRAPFDGRVVDLGISEGEFAVSGKPLFTLIDTRAWYVVANFRETELKKMRPGGAASVYLMTDPDQRFDGTVDSVGWGVLPDEGGSAQGLPKVPRSINWVHVAQRFPVRIRVHNPSAALFRIGASAVVTVAPDHAGEHR